MEEKEVLALISLLEDNDNEIVLHVETKINQIGPSVIPLLQKVWEENFNPIVQTRIEGLIQHLQLEKLKKSLSSWKASKDQNLLEGLVLVAQYQYPDINIDIIRNEIEQIYYEIWIQFQNELHFFDQVKIINNVLFRVLKFSGNTQNYHSPANNMINIVLEQKKGNPVILCSLYMILAQKLDMPIYGISLPNFFILTYKSRDKQFYINVFNRGLIFTKEEIDKYIVEMHLSPQDSFYQPCSNIQIVQRLLHNLTYAFEKLGDHRKTEEIKALINALK